MIFTAEFGAVEQNRNVDNELVDEDKNQQAALSAKRKRNSLGVQGLKGWNVNELKMQFNIGYVDLPGLLALRSVATYRLASIL